DAARAAGHLLQSELQGSRHIAYKGSPTNLVTEMDARAEELIVARLLSAFPEDGILAEERGARCGRSGRRWIIDPLDGTTNYAHGLPLLGVRRMGSAVLYLAWLATGRLDGYWELRLGPWDAAAGSLLVEEAGGRVTNLTGGALDLDAPALVASNGTIHAAMLAVLEEIRG